MPIVQDPPRVIDVLRHFQADHWAKEFAEAAEALRTIPLEGRKMPDSRTRFFSYD